MTEGFEDGDAQPARYRGSVGRRLMRLLCRGRGQRVLCLVFGAVVCAYAPGVQAQNTPLQRAIAQAVAAHGEVHDEVQPFYQGRQFEPLWMGHSAEHRQRRAVLLQVLSQADRHGLPLSRYNAQALKLRAARARLPRDRGSVEVALSLHYLRYARDVQFGILEPSDVSQGIARKRRTQSAQQYLEAITQAHPAAVLRQLPPATAEYARLIRHKAQLEQIVLGNAWGAPVPSGLYKPGDSGAGVAALRGRLARMGYGEARTSPSDSLPYGAAYDADAVYDADLEAAVRVFQGHHGLRVDGIAGPNTLAEINRPAAERLKSVIAALERERWMNFPRGARHVVVNLTDFHVRIVDNGKITFETRAVIGQNRRRFRSPEFSDELEYMVINPVWHVPRSIATREYLPQLQEDPAAVDHLLLFDADGNLVTRDGIDFTSFTSRSFPFFMKQLPGKDNAMGQVKFMLPNAHNIYLHDTPEKALFARNPRAFSHGCIRLGNPQGFAHALLAPQTGDPEALFQRKLNSGRQVYLPLQDSVPVHLIYRTAFGDPQGTLHYRRDVYGRDALLWQALVQLGVAPQAGQS